MRERSNLTRQNRKRRPTRANRVSAVTSDNERGVPTKPNSSYLHGKFQGLDRSEMNKYSSEKPGLITNVEIQTGRPNKEEGNDLHLDPNDNYQQGSELMELESNQDILNPVLPPNKADTMSNNDFDNNKKSSPNNGDELNEDWITLNVGGTVFMTSRRTFKSALIGPLTDFSTTSVYFHKTSGEFRFDRNPMMFQFILDYFRSGQLHMPPLACVSYFKAELDFWCISCDVISPCCYTRLQEHEEEAETLAHVERAFDDGSKGRRFSNSCIGSCVTSTWYFLEYPGSSCASKIWAFMYILMVLLSLCTMVLDTHIYFRVSKGHIPPMDEKHNSTKWHMLQATDPHPGIWGIELVTTLFFTIEIIIRFMVCPNKTYFLLSVLHWVDFLSSVASWILLGLTEFRGDYLQNKSLHHLFWACLIIRTLRVSRIFRLARHYRGLQILILALKASIWELFLLVVFIMFGTVVFATWIYYAEFDEPDNIPDIPVGFWWAVVTMTTVGYGDVHPVSPGGYVVGSLCALVGMLATGLPIPIIAHNFSLYYSYSKIKTRMEKRPRLSISFGQPLTSLLALVSPNKKSQAIELESNKQTGSNEKDNPQGNGNNQPSHNKDCDDNIHVETNTNGYGNDNDQEQSEDHAEEPTVENDTDLIQLENENINLETGVKSDITPSDETLVNEELAMAERQPENGGSESADTRSQPEPSRNDPTSGSRSATGSDLTSQSIPASGRDPGNPENPNDSGMPAVHVDDNDMSEPVRMRPLPRLLTAIPGRRPIETVMPIYGTEDEAENIV